jgi:protein-tyrosine phosphatase
MITDNIAIGDYNSPYDDFDIIVNLNYPYNYVQVYKITRNVMDNKLIYNIGLFDGVDQPMGKILEIMIPELLKELKENPNKKILFHCYAGISRSSTLAIALIYKLTKSPLVDIYKLAVSKRPQVQPNPGFIRALTKYTNDKSLLQHLNMNM